MSTSSVTPDQTSDAPQSALANAVLPSQPQTATAAPASQQPSTPAVGPRLVSMLGAIVSASTPTLTPTAPANNTPATPHQPAWKKAVDMVSTGLSSIPSGGRPSFLGGLGQGARAEQQAEANQQALKFKDFQSQVQISQLHNEDVRLQNATEDHQDTVQDHADAEADRMTAQTGMTYTKVPNTAANVTSYLTADAAQNGGATVPPGVIMGPHAMYIPNKGSADQAKADTTNYNMLAPAYGLPTVQPGQIAQPGVVNHLRQMRNGMDTQGNPMSAVDLGNRIDSLTSLKSTLPSDDAQKAIQSDIDHLTDLQQHHATRDQAGIDQATANKDKQAQDLQNIKTAGQKDILATKAANAPANTNMFVGTDPSGNQIAGTNDDLKAAGASGVTKLDSDTGKKVITARQLISPTGLFSQISQDMRNLKAAGKLDSSATARLNDAMLTKAGSDPDYAPLFVHTHLLATALMQAHVGSRGSENMMDEFKSLANAGKMNGATLAASLHAEYNYVHEKAMLPQKAGQ